MKLKILLAIETILLIACLFIGAILRREAEEQRKLAILQAEAMRMNTEKAEDEVISQRRIAEEAVARSEHYRQMLKECEEEN